MATDVQHHSLRCSPSRPSQAQPSYAFSSSATNNAPQRYDRTKQWNIDSTAPNVSGYLYTEKNREQKTKAHTPICMRFLASKAAANNRTEWGGFLSTRILQANLDIVLLDANFSEIVSSPGIVSITMKSTCVSADLPIWNMSVLFSISYLDTVFVVAPLNLQVYEDCSI